jgi:hypothetical protein
MQIELQVAGIISEGKDKTDEVNVKLKKIRKDQIQKENYVFMHFVFLCFLWVSS